MKIDHRKTEKKNSFKVSGRHHPLARAQVIRSYGEAAADHVQGEGQGRGCPLLLTQEGACKQAGSVRQPECSSFPAFALANPTMRGHCSLCMMAVNFLTCIY